MQKGTSTGVLDEFFATIHVGDEIVDKAGKHYTVDRFGRAKPTDGGNEMPLKKLEGLTVCKSWAGHAETITRAVEKTAPAPEPKKELDPGPLKGFNPGDTSVHDAPDQMLAGELRKRGWTVTCTKIVEKVVFEEVAL